MATGTPSMSCHGPGPGASQVRNSSRLIHSGIFSAAGIVASWHDATMPAALKIPEWMSLEEFLTWDAPGPGPWQLIDGVPVAMAPAGSTHGLIQSTIAH